MKGNANEFKLPPPKTLDAAFAQMTAEHERRRAVKHRQLRRKIAAGLIACVVFALLADVETWPGRAAILLAIAGAISALAAFLRLRRT